ncbi:MAG: Mut7-C ubiquitin/RNAse domain-containing protein [Caldilineaceae bacterium]|nr:Mut7-C ubiquitin/RNAse domain-containing protein [Caldilineaceae bacterium]
MFEATFRFYGVLNDFLPTEQRGQPIDIAVEEKAAVKHPIEALGVPHPEVEAILVNRRPVDFFYHVRAGDRVDVYPYDWLSQLAGYVALRPPVPAPVCFVADSHLGQLASYLRLLGFDTLYRNDYSDAELAQISAEDGRVLLTRDRGLLKHKIVVFGYCVRETQPRRQLISVLRRFELASQISPWQRCVRCNGLLVPVDKAKILHRLEPKTRLYYDDFQRCATCNQIYWQGSHFERMQHFLAGVRAELTN